MAMDLPFPPLPSFAPLAERMRPRDLNEFLGQEEIVGPGTLLRQALDKGVLPQSLILWGPPGCGKTTLARIIREKVRGRFFNFSAVTAGVADVKRVISEARKLRRVEKAPFILFVDEIHRFNKAQQDAFLPHIEDGTIVFIGATTENPSFEVIAPLLSRSRVLVLKPLGKEEILELIDRALSDRERGLGSFQLEAEGKVLDFLADVSQGDARVALNALDYAAAVLKDSPPPRRLTEKLVSDAVQARTVSTDKQGESHYNLISALHKSLRGGDPDASLYWLARMCEAGEDPLYVARRLVRFASEDVGNADPQALAVAVAAKEAVEFIGYPEGKLALAQAVVYLALAPKSNALYTAYEQAARLVHSKPPYPVPLHLRNAPTGLMKELGYSRGYLYPHDFPDSYTDQDYFPPELVGTRLYLPAARGFEAELKKRLEAYLSRRRGERE